MELILRARAPTRASATPRTPSGTGEPTRSTSVARSPTPSGEPVEDEVAEQVVREQTATGLDVVTDGLVRWYDPISHLARHCEGIQINGLLRYFDTNFYFRQPVVSGRIHRRESVLRREFEVARAATDRVVKPVLTGPYSLACGSILEGGYRNRRELARAYAEVLAHEIADLVHAGAALIQVDEPYLLRHPEHADLVHEGLATLAAARGRAHLALYTFFGDALPLWDDLMAMPVDLVGLDLTYGPKLADRIAEAGAPRPLVLGVVDGRNTKLEARDALLRILDRVLPALRGPVGLGPSCGLEFLPRARAQGEAREHGRDRARARGPRREAPMSRAKLQKSRPGPAGPAHLHRRQLPEARLSDRGPGAGHAQCHHADRARSPGAPGDRVLGADPGGARPRRPGGRRAVPRGHGRVLRRDDARLRPGRPGALVREPLLPQAGDGRARCAGRAP